MGRQPGNAVALVGWGLGIKWVNKEILFSYSTEMSPQCGYLQNYSDLLTLLQCQPVTNGTTVVQVHIN